MPDTMPLIGMTIKIAGADEVIKKLGPVQGADVLRRPMERSLERLRARLANYPPPPDPIQGTAYKPSYSTNKAGQKVRGMRKRVGPNKRTDSLGRYKRTGTLGRRWHKRVKGEASGLYGVVGNNTSYAPWVQSAERQALVHKGRWQTDRVVMQEQAGEIRSDFAAAIAAALA
jgi:hypothetical protein